MKYLVEVYHFIIFLTMINLTSCDRTVHIPRKRHNFKANTLTESKPITSEYQQSTKVEENNSPTNNQVIQEKITSPSKTSEKSEPMSLKMDSKLVLPEKNLPLSQSVDTKPLNMLQHTTSFPSEDDSQTLKNPLPNSKIPSSRQSTNVKGNCGQINSQLSEDKITSLSKISETSEPTSLTMDFQYSEIPYGTDSITAEVLKMVYKNTINRNNLSEQMYVTGKVTGNRGQFCIPANLKSSDEETLSMYMCSDVMNETQVSTLRSMLKTEFTLNMKNSKNIYWSAKCSISNDLKIDEGNLYWPSELLPSTINTGNYNEEKYDRFLLHNYYLCSRIDKLESSDDQKLFIVTSATAGYISKLGYVNGLNSSYFAVPFVKEKVLKRFEISDD
ncbi:uncharacterized protein LOC142332411 isoform X1 [Lycorma delicatula]|uniref:uncharacterized protein LOC142332411 isoform X1 n=1 Tax=Lycorma delicatula TaxID=130591 RepID=UPI003F519D2C